MRFIRATLAVAACSVLAGCMAGTAQFETLSEQDLPDDQLAPAVNAAELPEEGGLIDRLLSDPSPTERSLAATTPIAEDADPAEIATAPAPEKKGGLLSFLTGGSAKPAEPETAAEPVEVALASPDEAVEQPSSDAMPSTPRTMNKGIFGITSPKAKAVSEIAPGTLLPYGQVARICGLSKREMGSKVEQFPERRPKHVIYDSKPQSTAPRSFYITGFDDGCARQFTASMAVFGSVELHEQLRYGLPAEAHPYSDTDKAYETLKARVCGVARQKPCGAKVSKLQSDTVFVSIYERFGSNTSWTNLLLHGGDILAQDMKGG